MLKYVIIEKKQEDSDTILKISINHSTPDDNDETSL